jgi:outer membrane receptor protein involved in Fe transport
VLFIEGFFCRNKVSNGIRGDAVLDANVDTTQCAGLDAFQNVNLDEIVMKGFELNADARLDIGLEFGAGLSTLDAEDAINPDNPVGESFSSKYTGRAGYRDPAGRFWAEWNIRHSGEKRPNFLISSTVLVPSFTVQGLRAGARLGETDGAGYAVTIGVNNLTNALYAEAANTSFFRPQPKRGFTLTFLVNF